MNIEDIKIARDEAKKFLEFTEDFLKMMDGHAWGNPAERGLVRAQSIILSRALAAMRNERLTVMEQALQKIAAMIPGEYETEVECPHPTIMECDTCEEMQEIARKALEMPEPELTEGAYKASFTEELINAGYNQENPVPYHEPVEIDRHKMFIFGSCVGAVLTERRENDPHVVLTYLVEDDGFWSVLSGPISAYWVDDMLDLIKFMRNYMRRSGKFKELKDGYGYEWKD